jgi:hypothetical protein
MISWLDKLNFLWYFVWSVAEIFSHAIAWQVNCVERDKLQSESLNFTQSRGWDTILTGHSNLQRRQLFESEHLFLFYASNGLLHPVTYSVTGLYGSKRIKQILIVIGLLHGPWTKRYLSQWKSWPRVTGNIYLFILSEVEFYLRSRGCVMDLYLKQSVIPLTHSSGSYGNRELRGLCILHLVVWFEWKSFVMIKLSDVAQRSVTHEHRSNTPAMPH